MSNHKMNGALAIVVFLSRARWTSSSPTESRQCRPGFFHNVTLDLCQVCPSGMYTDSYNLKSRCNQCSRCTGLHMVVTACNASSDTVCRCPDGYYEHDDGCSPKIVAHVEERQHDKLEWTWIPCLLIVTFALVIILAIALVLHCSGVTKKLPSCPLKCKKGQSANGKHQPNLPNPGTLDNLASNDMMLNSPNEPPNQATSVANSESRQVRPPNGTADSAASDRANNATQQQRSEESAAAVGSTVVSSSTSFIETAARGAEFAGAQSQAVQTTAQTSVQVHSDNKTGITPQKEHRRSQTGEATDVMKTATDASTWRCKRSDHPAGCTKCVEAPDPLTVIGTVPLQQCVVGLGHQDDCVRCNDRNDLMDAAGTVSSAEQVQSSITSEFAMADTDDLLANNSNLKTDALRVNVPGMHGSRDHVEAEMTLHEETLESQSLLPLTDRKFDIE